MSKMDPDIENEIVMFMDAVPRDMERGKSYAWECPLCGGTVRGIRAEYNGHLWCKCEKCGESIIQ